MRVSETESASVMGRVGKHIGAMNSIAFTKMSIQVRSTCSQTHLRIQTGLSPKIDSSWLTKSGNFQVFLRNIIGQGF